MRKKTAEEIIRERADNYFGNTTLNVTRQEVEGVVTALMRAYASQEVAAVREKLQAAQKVLEEYEQWEADVLGCNWCWAPMGMAPTPTLSVKLWGKMIEIQGRRNEALERVGYYSPKTEKE